jgi:hypothetical protein
LHGTLAASKSDEMLDSHCHEAAAPRGVGADGTGAVIWHDTDFVLVWDAYSKAKLHLRYLITCHRTPW